MCFNAWQKSNVDPQMSCGQECWKSSRLKAESTTIQYRHGASVPSALKSVILYFVHTAGCHPKSHRLTVDTQKFHVGVIDLEQDVNKPGSAQFGTPHKAVQQKNINKQKKCSSMSHSAENPKESSNS